MELNKSDLKEIEIWIKSRFRELIQDELNKEINNLASEVLRWINEERSKTKFNEKDLMLIQIDVIQDVLRMPDKIINKIRNQSDIQAEGETAN